MTQNGFKRKLTAILCADVKGYSRLMGENEEATVRTLTAYREVIDAKSGHHLWANRFDRKLEDIFAVQDEITEEVVTALDVKLVRGEQARLWHKSLKNHKARDLFYQGKEIASRLTKETTTEARELFERVIELEPDSSLGYAWSA